MRRSPTPLKTAMLVLAVCALLAASATAGRSKQKNITIKFPCWLPGVDHYGDVDYECGGKGYGKLVINTKRLSFCATCKAKVYNKNRRPVRCYNESHVGLSDLANGSGNGFFEIKITRDCLTVGRGTYRRHYKTWAKAVVCGKVCIGHGGHDDDGYGDDDDKDEDREYDNDDDDKDEDREYSNDDKDDDKDDGYDRRWRRRRRR